MFPGVVPYNSKLRPALWRARPKSLVRRRRPEKGSGRMVRLPHLGLFFDIVYRMEGIRRRRFWVFGAWVVVLCVSGF